MRTKTIVITILFASALILVFCKDLLPKKQNVSSEFWGEIDGKEVHLYSLQNEHGMTVKITNFGGAITSIEVPDKDGNLEDVVLGYDNLKQYQFENDAKFGSIVGRFANRIRDAKFSLDDSTFYLNKNNGKHHIHGGFVGFDKKVWSAKTIQSDQGPGLILKYTSPDGEEGYPGNLVLSISYILNHKNELLIQYQGECDKPTLVNLTQHTYFNLTGKKKKIYDHLIQIDADYYLEIDSNLVPTGNILPLKFTSWDLGEPTRLGENIHKLSYNGYHYYYIFKKDDNQDKAVITIKEPKSRRLLQISTTQPGVQFYSGNSIGSCVGKKGVIYTNHDGICMETQHYPDAPNHPDFPSTRIDPGELYDETIVYAFDTY